MADNKIEELCREIFSGRFITADENDDLIANLQKLQTVQHGSSTPAALTPDRMGCLRDAAFRIACEYLVDGGHADDPREENVKLLKAINAVVRSMYE